MCLGIPMRVIAVDGLSARCEAKGVEREISLFLIQDQFVQPGDFLVMQGGYATGKMTQQEADAAWAVYDLMLQAEEEERS